MTEEKVKPVFVVAKSDYVSWRIYEREMCQKHFGLAIDQNVESITDYSLVNTGIQYVYWKMHTESTSPGLYEKCKLVAQKTPQIKHINSPVGWLNCHAKEKAWEVWDREGIPCPRWFVFKDRTDLFVKLNESKMQFPVLLRINNSTGGWHSVLVHNEEQAIKGCESLVKHFHYRHDKIPNEGVGRCYVASEYIDTTRPENLIMSFRIIVAGTKVVAGYARLGPPNDWVAITNRFTESMKEPFIKYQKVCEDFCTRHEELIVKSVGVLGLDFQGVDVILDKENRPYFIEVQPGFSVGYPNRVSWLPPYYNPSRPLELRNWLMKDENNLRKEMPFYYNCWLDKYNMFDRAFKALKEAKG